MVLLSPVHIGRVIERCFDIFVCNKNMKVTIKVDVLCGLGEMALHILGCTVYYT